MNSNNEDGHLQSFEQLECWRAARELKAFVKWKVLPKLPREERFELTSQMLRAARSVHANLAEGYGRFHYLDKTKFCSNARGSCTEVLDHLITASDERMIDESLLAEGREKVRRTIRLINGFVAYLRRAAAD